MKHLKTLHVCSSGAQAPHLLRYLRGALVLASFGAAPRSLGDRLSTGFLQEEEGWGHDMCVKDRKQSFEPPSFGHCFMGQDQKRDKGCVCGNAAGRE